MGFSSDCGNKCGTRSFFPHVITLVQAALIASMIFYFDVYSYASSEAMRGSVILLILHFANRLILCHYSGRLGKIAQRLSNLKLIEENGFDKLNCLLVIFCIVYCLVNIALTTARAIGSDGSVPILVTTILANVFQHIFFLIIGNILMIFFISVCHDIEQVIKSYRRFSMTQPIPDYRCLVRGYLSVRKLVLEVDSQMYGMVFCALATIMFICYFGLIAIAKPDELSYLEIVGSCFSAAYNALIFLLACFWANRVSSSAESVAEEAHCLEKNPENSLVTYICYLNVVNQDLCMTAWGFLPLRKNFVLATVGTLITYSVLIKNFSKN
ncbi:hypothetical protein HNY73_003689 [Argiope bruennichi]|uniref:Gustatory receptor n=1 Tax=Argiope bruennichi TaxID=94029 RepID=A0A8T0FQW2_ARGBR|nr:hypothetical protein HNY73_003689 [Argiope bruennichi]